MTNVHWKQSKKYCKTFDTPKMRKKDNSVTTFLHISVQAASYGFLFCKCGMENIMLLSILVREAVFFPHVHSKSFKDLSTEEKQTCLSK